MHIPTPNDTQYELPPAGTQLATCYRVIDLGTQETTYLGQSKRQHKVLLSWELPDEKMADGRPFTISQRYTWSMSEKASLRKDLESWRGVPFTERDFGKSGFDVKNIIGKSCLLNIVHAEKGDKRYANITSVSKLMKGQTPPADGPVNEKMYLWLHESRWSPEIFHKLSDGLKSAIMSSPEYKALVNGFHDEPPPVDSVDDFAQDIPF
jgi:hypothetical protein